MITASSPCMTSFAAHKIFFYLPPFVLTVGFLHRFYVRMAQWALRQKQPIRPKFKQVHVNSKRTSLQNV